MTDEIPDDLTDEERALFGCYGLANDLALRCRLLRAMDATSGDDALLKIAHALTTDFWDQGFSQTEIREAFMSALADMNRYAAGQERR